MIERRSSLRLFMTCLGIAVGWDFLYLYGFEFLDPDHRFDLWLAEAPRWVQRIHLWTPHLVAVRILRMLGFRFDMQHYDENTGFILASTMLTWLIWTLALYGVIRLVGKLRRPPSEVVAA